jgi:hypothetical protein
MTLKSFEPFTRLDAADLNDNNEFLQEQTDEVRDQSVQPFADSAARGSAIPTPADGQVTTLADDKNLQTYYGQYRPLPFAMEVKEVSVTGNGATTRSVAFTFIAGRFTEAPICLTTPESSVYTSSASMISSTGLQINIRNVLGSTFTATIPVRYLAIQMSNGTAAG